MNEAPAHRRGLGEVARVFFKLGTIAFGGPAVHVAMMRDEMVVRRNWVGAQEFADAFGAVNLLPGPSSTQLSMYLGRRRAGWRGLVVGGVCFIGPAMAIVLGLAWAYVRYGRSVVGSGLLYGIKPMVIAVVGQALWALGRSAIHRRLGVLLALASAACYFAGVDILVVLLAAAALSALARTRPARPGTPAHHAVVPVGLVATATAHLRPVRLPSLWWEFCKLGAVVFGSGYVLLAYLRRDLVGPHGWITAAELLDAIAIGQLTPGPVFTTATFIGYLVAGVPGALVATAGIFLPSFVMVLLAAPLVPRLRASPLAAGALDGVNAAAIGLMAGLTVDLGRAALVDVPTVLLAGAALVALLRFKLNTAWVVLAGAGVGVLHAFA